MNQGTGCGSKPMVPFWGRCTTHFGTYFGGDWDVHGGYGILTPWPTQRKETAGTGAVSRGARIRIELMRMSRRIEQHLWRALPMSL